MSAPRQRVVVGVDTGGTFTDFVAVWPDGTCRVHKCPSTPDNPARAVLGGLAELLGSAASAAEITYGSTVATNAVLERKGARVAVVTTSGFEDLLEIARQVRPDIYSLLPVKPVPLVPAARRFGVAERLSFSGEVLEELSADEVERVVGAVERSGAGSVAICLLHSYANPEHERLLAEALRARDFECSASAELVAEYREYERLSTTVINAYVAPVMRRHLGELARGVESRALRVMQSSGGAVSVGTASLEAVRTLLSGPAGGVVGAMEAARRIGESRLITFDMGGTSTDVSLVDVSVRRHTEWTIGDLPVKVPAIDIHTVGAGGGSIARVDEGGALKVGPESAGAVPGPACYGRGRQPTVTDADLVLGRLPSESLLGGRLPVQPERAQSAVARLANPLRMTAEQVAEGIVRVANASMERAIRTISVQRGLDPREYLLVAFGGAAGMHACELAESLGMSRVLVPLHPGVLSAWGALRAPTERNYVQTVRMVDPEPALVERRFRPLVRRAKRDLRGEAKSGARSIRCTVDARYRGQSYEIEIPFSASYHDEFQRAHHRLYGHAEDEHAVEVVNLRVSATVRREVPQVETLQSESAPAGKHRLWWAGKWVDARRFERRSLPARGAVNGPLVITEVSATTLVPPGWNARVAKSGDLVLERTQ